MNYDVIGDIHGHYDHLVGLLTKLGYQEREGVWSHQERQAVFVGDFIDRGLEQWKVITTVRDMVATGSALAVMGNHEFNSIAYATPNPNEPGEMCRRNNSSNKKQHAAFLDQLTPAQQAEANEWFMTLPLWLELPGLRVVHAYWSDESVALVRNWLGGDCFTNTEQIVEASTMGTAAYEHVELLLKGPELDISDGRYQFHHFFDKERRQRHMMRVRWWSQEHRLLHQLFDLKVLAPEVLQAIDASQLVDERDRSFLYTGDTPVIFGHHWRSPEGIDNHELIDFATNAICVDFSAAKGGYLVAYQFDQGHGPALRAENLRAFRPY
jgi:hypothetical protein